jgi:two-component system NtrC family response regulator
MANVLIVDDDTMMCDLLSRLVKNMGHDATCAFTLKDGLREVHSNTFDVVFLDVGMPDGSGLEVIPEIRETSSSPEVIIITGSSDPDAAELAIKNGAWDYIQKPSSVQDMTLPFVRALQYQEEKKGKKPLIALKRDAIIGNSPQMRSCFDSLAQAASNDASVLITGETGTGKELFAEAIHNNSSRSGNNFVVVDCAALPETLVESVLFGYEKSAFTGADKNKDGLVKQADGGTLFLDEVGELPLSLQKAFLRVLQAHRYRPIGGKYEVASNFRLVAATNQNLGKMVKSGSFRSDLLFRLHSLTIELLPLREHPEDIKELVLYYTAKLCESYGIGTKGFSPEFFSALTSYSWPGNVRELFNVLEKTLAATRYDQTLFPKHLPSNIRIQVARTSVNNQASGGGPQENISPSKEIGKLSDVRETAVAEVEKQYLQELMSITEGNINQSCQVSGLSRPRLYALLKKYKISRSQ